MKKQRQLSEPTVDLIPEQSLLWRRSLFCSNGFHRSVSRLKGSLTHRAADFTPTADAATRASIQRVTPRQRCGLLETEDLLMDTALTFILLLRCWCVCSPPSRQSVSFSTVFSGGTLLLVYADEEAADCDEDDLHHQRDKTAGSGPSVQILSSVPFSLDPESPHLLVCVLTGLNSPLQDVMWWVDDTAVTSSDVSWTMSEGGGAYSVTSVWEVPAADWRSRSTYWCGTIQEGQVYKQKLCSQDPL
ncbi:uncharacterized protein LOC129094062 [Anoplopoma fimbria]|uniref:uncharacterized protein LOC129094062 n=1 Tax=Anoplopoma fimbria TaxID=229290 RepID=UPI0023ECA5AC|nr:uncharacterized protein LOC129094062 [Anoplopoma fimbria]